MLGKSFGCCCAWVVALAFAQVASAQDGYPARPIKLIVPYASGGNIDITARVVAQSLGAVLGQGIVVENRPGAGGLIGAADVARAAPDGYTLLLGSSGSLSTAPAIYRNVTFDSVKDFVAIGPIQTVPLVLEVSNALPVGNFAELVAYSQSHGPVKFGVSGIGSLAHLALLQITGQTKLQTLDVPYTSATPALNDLLGKHVEAMVDQLSSSISYIKAGNVKAVAQLGAARSPLLPDVPTLAEQGLRDFDAETYTGLFAPAGIPKPVEQKLVQAFGKAMADPKVGARFKQMGADVMHMDQATFARFVATDRDKWKKIAHDANIVVQ